MNVFELRTSRPLFVNPVFDDFSGECAFPSWFMREVIPQLQAREPYTVATGAGLIARMAPFVGENYPSLLNTGTPAKLPLFHVLHWAENMANLFKQSIVDAFHYESDDLYDGIQTLQDSVTLGRANSLLARTIKRRRDALESVALICEAFGYDEFKAANADLDAFVKRYASCLNEDVAGGDRCLQVIKHHFPDNWWGVRH